MRYAARVLAGTALLAGGQLFGAAPGWAGSCCGGTAGAILLVPRLFTAKIESLFEWEKYDGYWDEEETHQSDPPGSDLNQYRLTVAYAHRFSPRWQASLGVPYVWNDTEYSGESSRTQGVGDTSVNLWWETAGAMLHVGPGLLVPTGISPYDDVDGVFDVTGRGFYRLDLNALWEASLSAWDFQVFLAYGRYLERDVNREYGRYVEPYRKRLGDRWSGTATVSYSVPVSGVGRWTGSAAFSHLREGEDTYDGDRDPDSDRQKSAVTGSLVYLSTDQVWTVKASWSHALASDGWGKNFPTTDTYALGVSYGFR